MNKKKLSVVMAGAMLASSVAPVLAATESTMTTAELGMLVQKVRKQIESKRFSNETELDKKINGNEAGNSVYYVATKSPNKAEARVTTIDSLTVEGKEDELQNALQVAFKDLKAGDEVIVYSKGFKEEGDKVYANSAQTTYTASMLTSTDLTNEITRIKEQLNGVKTAVMADVSANVAQNSSANGIELTFVGSLSGDFAGKTKVELKEGSDVLDFSHYYDADRNVKKITEATAPADIYGFPKASGLDLTYPNSYPTEKVETIKIEAGDAGTALKASDLYDGLMLTTKGHELLSLIKETEKNTSKSGTHAYTKVEFSFLDGTRINRSTYNLPKNSDGTYSFAIKLTDKFNTSTTYTVTGTKEEAQTLLDWLFRQDPTIDLLAGNNRYETAVSIAKEQVGLESLAATSANETNIVLVNGGSLVDGLAAAPLAAHLTAGTGDSTKAAPILLTEADGLPKATKEYLKELIGNKSIKDVKTKIHLVGGTAVLSKELENELRGYGFKIKRYNGDNREETSLKVAEAIGNTTSAFIVGANGEADAMSIAPVAADNTNSATGNKVTPIIVSKNGGISDDALSTLDNKAITVIGGEKAVSAEDYEAIKEAVDKDNPSNTTAAVRRIFGANRKATNAAIINTFYGNSFGGTVKTKKVIVAKDNVLVDALTAANLASQEKAPIVLATNSLSEEQINALELNAKTAKNLYQVGLGVNPDVIKTVAQNLGLVK